MDFNDVKFFIAGIGLGILFFVAAFCAGVI